MSDYESDYEYESDNSVESDDYKYIELYNLYKGIINIDFNTIIKTITINLLDFFEVDEIILRLNKSFIDYSIVISDNQNEIINIYYTNGDRSNDKNNGILNVLWRKLKMVKPVDGIIFTRVLLDSLKDIFISLNKICIVCFDNLHITTSKPTICDKDSCIWSMENFNIGFSVKDEIIHNFEVCNLLFELFKETLKDVKSEKDMIFYFNFSPEFITENGNPPELYTYLRDKQLNYNDQKIINVMNYILSNNKSIIIKIKNFIDADLKTFIFQSASVNKESKFQKLKKQYGSYYVYSGSPLKNWFSITKNGLKILSNTDKMTSGAVYGKGIYSSTDMTVALEYTGFSDNMLILALCEVINDKSKIRVVADRNINVIMDEDIIITRFLLVLPANKSLIRNTRTLKVPEYGYTESYTRPASVKKSETCPICLDDFNDEPAVVGVLCKSGHYFHKDCFDQSIETLSKCPICGVFYKELIGEQPDGTMSVRFLNSSLPGFPDDNIIEIFYNIPSGKNYTGTTRTAYLPNNKKGQKILELLKKAFHNKLIFKIGTSLTTGQDNVVVWNGIHHKTSIDGSHGYPDPTYLDRVLDELKQKGLRFGKKVSKNVY